MPVSSAAWYVHWIIYFKFFLANRAPLWLLERNARKSFGPENSPEVLPSAITTNDKISVEREVFSAGQEWEVFHVAPTGDEREKKVVVYWHGGAFIKRVRPLSRVLGELSNADKFRPLRCTGTR
jgi:acetyl esterase/lipase